MLQIVPNIWEVKNSNFLVFVKNTYDLEKLSFLDLPQQITKKIQEIMEKQKNTSFKIYLGRDDFEEIILFFYLDITQDIYGFLWENISLIPEKITFEYQKDNILLDSIILWKYDFHQYKSEKKELEIYIICQELQKNILIQRLSTLKNITDTRDIVNTPSSDKTPDKYYQFIRNIKFKNIKIKVLEYEDIKKEWLWLLEAVGKASISKPKLVILEKIVDKRLPYIGFVGKWITFDTGGLNIKTWDYMYGMKDDMAGSAALLFMMKEIDDMPLNCNVITALCIAENSISWDAYRPGDILTSYSKKTVEIINTDAEGRLVLADGISYISKNYELESITSVATLTWACMVALWYHYAGIMWNNRDFIQSMVSNPTFEKYVELPLDDYFVSKTKWEISDLKNLSTSVMAGASMGGAFLKNFCLQKELFTHIDIAWPSMVKEKYWLFNIWATGFWVESLSKYIWEYGKTTEG